MNILSRHTQVLQNALLRSHAHHVVESEDRIGNARMQRLTGMEVATLCAYLVALLVSHYKLPHVHDTAARALVALLPLPLGFLAMVALYGVARRSAQRYYA